MIQNKHSGMNKEHIYPVLAALTKAERTRFDKIKKLTSAKSDTATLKKMMSFILNSK